MKPAADISGNTKLRQSEFLLLLTAIIWGFAFVAQRAGMEFVGPFTFNGIRFALGGLSLLPIWWFLKNQTVANHYQSFNKPTFIAGSVAGIALFVASSFQQIGIIYTTAGKAGFITGLYIIFVPVFGIFAGTKTSPKVWSGAVLATVGLYYLSVSEALMLSIGDALVLVSALFFAIHILVINRFSKNINPLLLSIVQFMVCSLLSFAVAIFNETLILSKIYQAAIPIIYGGIFSVGIAYTLQVFGQKHTPPAIASIILSLEAIFAAIGGWFILNEVLTGRNILGCILMLVGMVLAQLPAKLRNSGV